MGFGQQESEVEVQFVEAEEIRDRFQESVVTLEWLEELELGTQRSEE